MNSRRSAVVTALRRQLARLRAIASGRRLDQELDEELAAHVAMATDDYVKTGLSHEQARRAALLRLGNRAALAEQHRELRGIPLLETAAQDVRFTVRMLVRSPWFAATAILTLTLGIAANTAVFSIYNSLLLEPLPYPDADRLVMILERDLTDGETGSVTPADFVDWRQRSRSFAHLAGLSPYPHFNLTVDGEPERLSGAAVSASFFDLLGTRLALGRSFRADEEKFGQDRVVVLSHDLWVRRFKSDVAILGRAINLSEQPHVVVGVLPADFRFIAQRSDFNSRRGFDVWVPLAFDPELLPKLRETHPLRVFGRLAEGVTPAQSEADLSAVARQLAQEHPKSNEHRGVQVVSLATHIFRDVKTGLLALQVAVGLVLLIACANVANLLLTRAVGRRHEFAVRIALGASAPRVYRQVLTEAGVLAVIGGTTGLLAGWWMLGLLKRVLPEMPRVDEIGPDMRVVAFTAGLSLVTSLVFAAAPLIQQLRVDPNDALKNGSRGSVAGSSRVRYFLTVVEIALAFVLVVGAGLIVQSLWRLMHVQPGFQIERVLAAKVSLSWSRYRTPAATSDFHRRVLERVRALPGVQYAGATAFLPLGGTTNTWGFHIEHQPPPKSSARYRPITPGLVEAIGIPVIAGRTFTESDSSNAPRVVLISDTLKRAYFPNQEAVGKRLRLLDPTMEWRTIVGVVGDVRHDGLNGATGPDIYLPDAQTPFPVLDMSLVVRTTFAPEGVISGVRDAARAVDPNQPIYEIETMTQVVESTLGQPRFHSTLLTGFAVAALTLACLGIYGVMAQAVAGRTRELAVRAAMGATGLTLKSLVLRQAAVLTGIGLLVGLAGATLLTRLLGTLLYEVSATDPRTMLGAALLLSAVAFLAAYVPARRAGRVDVISVLRQE
jgi:putative ABC transport system permease protein